MKAVNSLNVLLLQIKPKLDRVAVHYRFKCDIRTSTVTGILATLAGHQWRAAKQSYLAFHTNSDVNKSHAFVKYRRSSPCLQKSELLGTFMSRFISSLKLNSGIHIASILQA
jgi:hypothetical protein